MTIKMAICGYLLLPLLLVTSALDNLKQPISRPMPVSARLEITTSPEQEITNRTLVLRQFFLKNKSPLVEQARSFVEIADKYNLDYRLLPAISCTESSCGKFLIKSSHNPFGWGIYGNKVTSFSSYDEAIEKVAAGISKHYASHGLDTPEKIGPKYNPNTPQSWSGKTRYFMNQIDAIAFN
jgi:hypothetical protein